MNLGVRHLRVVVAVADSGGYTAASRRLHVAQSSLSRTVQEVEQRLGVALFDRTTRTVRPTRDGAEFLVIARRLLADFDTALRHFEGYLAGVRGAVSIAALPSLAASMLPPVLAEFRASRPEVVVSIRDGLSEEVLDLVVTGAVDMAVTVADTVPPPLEARRIAVDRFVCVLPREHRLRRRTTVVWSELAGEDFVFFDPRSSIRSYVDRTLTDTGTRVGAVTEARNIAAVAGLTASGLGLSVVPSLVLPLMTFAGLDHRPLIDPVVERDICLIHHPHRPRSRTAEGFMALLADTQGRAIRLPDGVRWT